MDSVDFGGLAEASCLLHIIMFLEIAYGLGNVFNVIRGETSACAQDVPKTDRGVRLMYSLSIPCVSIGYYTCPPDIGS